MKALRFVGVVLILSAVFVWGAPRSRAIATAECEKEIEAKGLEGQGACVAAGSWHFVGDQGGIGHVSCRDLPELGGR